MIVYKVLRKIYIKTFGRIKREKPVSEQDPDKASELIYKKLMADEPCMVARFGSTELLCLTNYLGVHRQKKQPFKFIKGETYPWWWEEKSMEQMQKWSGFFPPTQDRIEKFCELMIEDMKTVDILGSWLPQESDFENEIHKAKKVRLVYLEPFWTKTPWTKALEGKKVLVIHPFSETIQEQYKKRDLLFDNNLLPEFELKTIKAVQSLGGVNEDFEDWFEALDFMKNQIDQTDFDICIIGAGAYGFPLAAHVKRIGKKALHLGGSTQLLFGIKGKRWETKEYGKALNLNYPAMFNEHWVKPNSGEKPKTSKQVEDNCYW
ncbi:GT-D fold domain-containing protein [Ochrovirga pacifica]|uniref:GT-D fold domain-containing protein n=1 Tax=Ochrovirga pacifica TaxID=1042376 RepID=UPI00192BA2D2|nr:hypothetical protein [Ochrovirga pacifica]